MAELQFLLRKIRPASVKYSKPAESSPELLALMERVDNRHWQAWCLEELIACLVGMQSELLSIKHVRKCEQCQLEWQLSIERYMGTRCPWYLNLEYEVGFGEEVYENDQLFHDCPRLENYKIGSYWTKSSDDTLRFIFDRMKWAEDIIKHDVQSYVDFYFAVENWDCESSLPPQATRFYMLPP